MTNRTTPDRASLLQGYVRERMIKARLAAGLTQQAAANRIGVTQTAVSYWESGAREIGLSELDAFALATSQPLEFFLPSTQPEEGDEHVEPYISDRDEKVAERAMSGPANTVIEEARKAALVFINHDLPSLAVARGDAEMACDAVMRVLLTELRKQILDCALVGEYVPGAPEISSFGPDGGAYNEAAHACYDVVESLLKELANGL